MCQINLINSNKTYDFLNKSLCFSFLFASFKDITGDSKSCNCLTTVVLKNYKYFWELNERIDKL